MSVFQRSQDGRWCAQWNENGKKKRRYFQTKTEAEAFERERVADSCPEEQALSMGELVARYFRQTPTNTRRLVRTSSTSLPGMKNQESILMV